LISSYTTTRNDFNFCSSAQTKARKKPRKVVDKSNNKLQKLLQQTVQSTVNKTTKTSSIDSITAATNNTKRRNDEEEDYFIQTVTSTPHFDKETNTYFGSVGIILCCSYNNIDEEQSSSSCIGWHSVCDVDGTSYRLACPTNNRDQKKDHKEQELVSIWNDKPDSKISEVLLP
jgi:hypothetical protein